MKSHYYLAQALLAMRHVSEALKEAQYAYSTCLETKDSSAEILNERYERGEVGETGRNEELSVLEKEAAETRRNIREAFKDPAVPESVERVCH
jgi:hypothetical protein